MLKISERDLTLADGRTLHVYDTGAESGKLTVVWHHGTPNIGTPPQPLFEASERLGIRWVGYDRPSYGGSSPQPGRNIATAAALTAHVTDALGIDSFTVMGHSGGGPHALACAALLPNRVLSVVSVSGLAPYGAKGFDYFAGLTPAGEASIRAALAGRTAKEAHEASAEFDPETFTPSDYAALSSTWSWFESVVEPAQASGPGGLIDDDVAYVAPWGFDVANIVAPTLLVHGEEDRMVLPSHSRWLAHHIPSAELQLYPDDGHISVLHAAPSALAWLCERAKRISND